MNEIREEEHRLTKEMPLEYFAATAATVVTMPEAEPHNKPHPSGLNRRKRRELAKADR